MKKIKSDFPKITYNFVNKVNYNRSPKKHILLKIIISMAVLLTMVYTVSFFVAKFQKPDEPKKEPVNEVPKKNNRKRDYKASKSGEGGEIKRFNEESKNHTEAEQKKSIGIEENIVLQSEIFGLKGEELSKKIESYDSKSDISFKDSYLFPSDAEKIPKEIIESFTKEQASLVRNEIYARRGYSFKGKLYDFFSLKSWYNPTAKKAKLSDIEMENVKAIYAFEVSKGWK